MIFRGLTLPDVPYSYRIQDIGMYSVRLRLGDIEGHRVRLRADDVEGVATHIEIAQVMFSPDAVHKSIAMQAMVDALNAAAAST